MASASPPIEEACYWLARAPRPTRPTLAGTARAEVAIVGGGLTGLWTALHLKAASPSLDVAIVEGETLAYGASGRNAGILSDTIDHSHGLAIQHFGVDEARRLAQLGRANVAQMLGWLEAHAVDCDLERTGGLQFALREAHLAALADEVEAARTLGIDDLRLLDAAGARAALRCASFQGALFNPAAAVLDPVKLVEGLARAAEAQGVRIYERSPVRSLAREGDDVRLRTDGGELGAAKVVVALSAYTHHLLPRVLGRFMPLYDYVLVSEPLSPAQRDELGWQGRQGATDARTFFNYYRLTRDDRVLWGTSEAAYYPPNRVDTGCDHSPLHYAALRAAFTAQFPALADLRFPYAWGGPICATTRFTPFFGRALGDRVHYALGFTGHGLGTTHLAARVLADRALDRSGELEALALVRSPPLRYPPEPVRRWAVGKVTRDLRRVDEGDRPSLLLRLLDAAGIGLSS